MTQSKPHILIVDDDPGIRQLLQRYLNEQNMQVGIAEDAISMDSYLQSHSIDLLILDVMMPGEDGLSIARRLRAESQLPIIILSAKGEDVEKIIGLEMGADDYMAKPFNPRELLARIKTVLRRQNQQYTPTKDEANIQYDTNIQYDKSEKFEFGEFTLDFRHHSLHQLEQNIDLTNGEFTLLSVLSQHANRVLSRDQLMDLISGNDREAFDRSIDIRITRLRKKIERDPKSPKFIRTIWGSGYMFTPDGQVK